MDRPGVNVPHEDGKRQRQVGDDRERVTGSQRHGPRRKQGEQLGLEMTGQGRPGRRIELVPATDPDPAGCQGRHAVLRRPGLPLHQPRNPRQDRVALFPGAHPVEAPLGVPLRHRGLERTDPDREELVQIGTHDREIPEPFRQRDPRILTQLEHPLMKRKLGEFDVEELLGGRVGGRPARGAGWPRGDRRRRHRPGHGRGQWIGAEVEPGGQGQRA